MGQWKLGNKDGDGVLQSKSIIESSGRMHLEWKKGSLKKKEPYNSLTHGTNTTEAGTWAAHYAKDAAIDATLVAAQRVLYPGQPKRAPRQVEYAVRMALKQAQENVKTGTESDMEYPKDQGDDKYRQRILVSAREFRRLISLVHSSDPIVEELVLPILDDAKEVEESKEGQQGGFMIGPIWTENLFKLQCHFAAKIQRQWRRTGMRRVMRKVKLTKMDDEHTWEDMQKQLEEEVAATNRHKEANLLHEIEASSVQLVDRDIILEGNAGSNVAELAHRARQLFRLEAKTTPTIETMDCMLLSKRMIRRLNQVPARKKELAMSQLVEFDSDLGLASYIGKHSFPDRLSCI